ncbi:MAG TPA: sigma-70 factor domain-containing protein, partial [Kofleriaceae bacterium]|nr:sigma-70 factor domain-containing protein [Kofleriaceae bacterium]
MKVAAQRPVRAPDADDHLAAYFRQLAEHELLSPEDERELSQGIEDTEIMTWERVLSRPEIVKHVLALVEPNLEQPAKFPKLEKLVEDMLATKKARKEPKLVKKLAACAKEAATQLRALDLDRVHIDAVVRELYRAREAALASADTWWTDGTSK